MTLKRLVMDIETYYASDYSLSLGHMTTEKYIRDPRFKIHGAGLKVDDGPAVWVTGSKLPAVIAKIDWSKVVLIGHNLQFDATILSWHFGVKPRLYVDTLGMSRALIGQHSARHGLHYICPLVTSFQGHPLHKMDGLAHTKGVRDLEPWQEKILADYTVQAPHFNPKTGLWEAGDAVLTWELFKGFAKHFPTKELKVIDWTIRQFAQPKIFLDDEMLTQYLKEVKDEKLFVVEEVFYTFSKPGYTYWYSPAANKVFRDVSNGDLLALCTEIDKDKYWELRCEGCNADRLTPEQFEQLRKILASGPKYAQALTSLGVVPPVKINPKGEVKFAFAKTDQEHKALLEHDNPKVQALVAARMSVKSTIEETRAEKYLDASVRGAWPVAYSYSGAVNTHRFSGNKGGGGNPMNLKRGGTLRNCIYAPEGKTFLVLDLSQIECRLALWFGMLSTRNKGMEFESLERLRRGDYHMLRGEKDLADKYDLYSYFGSMMFGWEVIKSKHKNERQIAKSAVLGLGFGMGPARYMDYALIMGAKGVDAALAESTVHLYRNTYSGVKGMWSTLENMMLAAIGKRKTRGGILDLPEKDYWQVGPLRACRDPIFGSPSICTEHGLLLKYPDLSYDAMGEGTYRDGNGRVKIFGGKYMENVAQHTARLILVDQLMEIDQTYPVVMSTYDEGVVLIDDNPEAIEVATKHCVGIMTKEHPMFPGLPLGVEWGVGNRYGTAKN